MFFAFAAGAALVILFYAPPAHAYLDPGSVSMALQAITATVAAGFAALALFWGKVKAAIFGGRTGTPPPRDKSDPFET
jgi:hypothetical protein